jgi:hypothetical protein
VLPIVYLIEELNIVKKYLLQGSFICVLALLVACGGATPTPAPTEDPTKAAQEEATWSADATEQVLKYGTPTPTVAPADGGLQESTVRDWEMKYSKDYCTRNYNEDPYDMQVLKVGSGHITAKMSQQGLEGIWCTIVTGKCGNSKVKYNTVWLKSSQDHQWHGNILSDDWGTWQTLGCPFDYSGSD